MERKKYPIEFKITYLYENIFNWDETVCVFPAIAKQNDTNQKRKKVWVGNNSKERLPCFYTVVLKMQTKRF